MALLNTELNPSSATQWEEQVGRLYPIDLLDASSQTISLQRTRENIRIEHMRHEFPEDSPESASTISLAAFLHTKVLWLSKDHKLDAKALEDYVAKEFIDEASAIINGQHVQAYLATVKENGIASGAYLATFNLVKSHQNAIDKTAGNDRQDNLELTPRPARASKTAASKAISMAYKANADLSPLLGEETPRKIGFWAPETPPTRDDKNPHMRSADEEIVNHALIDFLKALSFSRKSPSPRQKTDLSVLGETPALTWTGKRKNLLIQSYKGQGQGPEKVITAKTDGFLWLVGGAENQDTLAIVEVKGHQRRAKRIFIERQEGTQLAAWICQAPARSKLGLLKSSADGLKRRLLISQDREQIYIHVGEYGDEYIKYVKGESPRYQLEPPSPPQPPARGSQPSHDTQRSVSGSSNNSSSSSSLNPADSPSRSSRDQQFIPRVDQAAPSGGGRGWRATIPDRSKAEAAHRRGGRDSGSPPPPPPRRAAVATSSHPGAQKPLSQEAPSQPASGQGGGFLRVKTYGPYDIHSQNDMLTCCVALVALMLQLRAGFEKAEL